MFFKKKKDVILSYTEPTGEFTTRAFWWSEWWVAHRDRIERIGVWALAVFAVVSMSFSLWHVFTYLFFGYAQDQQMVVNQVNTFSDYTSVQARYTATNVAVRGVDVFPSSPGRFDIVADVYNPNERWIATMNYHFSYVGGETAVATDVLLPKEARPVVAFGIEESALPQGARLVIDSVKWMSIDPHQYPNIQGFIADKEQVSLSGLQFARAGGNDGSISNRIEFDITNETIFGMWSPLFFIELLNNGTRVGLIPVTIDIFLPGETRHVDVRSLVDRLFVTDVNLIPVFNVFDVSIFISPEQDV